VLLTPKELQGTSYYEFVFWGGLMFVVVMLRSLWFSSDTTADA